MVIVKGAFPVKARQKEEALALVQSFAEDVRAERGCLACEVYCQADAPATIMLWQQWRSSAALKSHFSSDAMDRFLDRLTLLLDGMVDTLYFDVETDGEPPAASLATLPASCVAEDVILH
jgi:quinol monooxygenase YgiN